LLFQKEKAIVNPKFNPTSRAIKFYCNLLPVFIRQNP
jgi:hypothetical protein